MARRNPSTGVSAAQERARAAVTVIPVPEGLSLETDEQRTLWEQLSRMKLDKDWRIGDLVQLHEVVMLTVRIREGERTLDQTGYVILDRFDQPKEHPLVNVVARLRGQRQTMLRSLGLMVAMDQQSQLAVKKAAPSVVEAGVLQKTEGAPSLLALN